MKWQPTASLEAAQLRAKLYEQLRAFFKERNVLEVETPTLSVSTIPDPHIHSLQTVFAGQPYYLQTSPEFHMKRLLAAGFGDIFQISKAFRDDEQGSYHNPEFSLLEWYRQGFDHMQLMDEIQQLFVTLYEQLNPQQALPSFSRISYQQAFLDSLSIDPLTATANELKEPVDYAEKFTRYHTAAEMAGFLLELYDGDKTVGEMDFENFRIKLSDAKHPHFG